MTSRPAATWNSDVTRQIIMDSTINKLKQKFEVTLPWATYALGWSNVAPNPRLFVGSFLISSVNSLHGIDLHLREANTCDKLSYHPSCTSPTDGLPVSQIVCQPSKHGLVDGGEELVAAASDAVRLWRAFLPEADCQLAAIQAAEKGLTAPPPEMVLVAELANRRQSQRAPLTGLDWAAADSRLLITSSVDTTCTVWDLEASKVKTQLIAHDRSVLDVQFASGQSDIFGSAGEDGSVRLFDLRSLDQSTILFESGDTSGKEGSSPPLLRLRFNRSDENYLAVLELGSLSALVLDVRMPGVQVARLCGHTSPPTSLAWHPLSRNHLVTGGDDGYTHLWDLNKAAPEKSSGFQFTAAPEMSFESDSPVHNLTWSVDDSDNCFLAIGLGDKIKVMSS